MAMETSQFGPRRDEWNGKFRYPAVAVRAGGRVLPLEFADWFATDAAAEVGFREIMTTQGYEVRAVRIGTVTEVEIA